MALLAEEIVEEWLNRLGYFTIRGAKIGVNEIDILAVRPGKRLECRHIEVQASSNPVSYVSPTTKSERKKGIAANSARKRSPEYLQTCVDEWLERKFFSAKKDKVRKTLAPGPWSFELVLHHVKHSEEIKCISHRKIVVHRLADVIKSLVGPENVLGSAAGSSLIELVLFKPHVNE